MEELRSRFPGKDAILIVVDDNDVHLQATACNRIAEMLLRGCADKLDAELEAEFETRQWTRSN